RSRMLSLCPLTSALKRPLTVQPADDGEAIVLFAGCFTGIPAAAGLVHPLETKDPSWNPEGSLTLCRSTIPSGQPRLRWVAASLDQVAAIHIETHAGGVTRRRRNQVKHRPRHLFGLRHTPHG